MFSVTRNGTFFTFASTLCFILLLVPTTLVADTGESVARTPDGEQSRFLSRPMAPGATSVPAGRDSLVLDESPSVVYRAFLSVTTGSELFRARRLGAPVSTPGVHAVELTRRELAALRAAGLQVQVVGGTSRITVAPELVPSTPTRVSSNVAETVPPATTGTIPLSSGIIDLYIEDDTGSAQGWQLRNQVAPAGAEVTALRYRTRISDDGDGSIWCGDYEIWLFSGTSSFEHLVYDNLGGSTDGGFDDDTADDSDIYLNWRTTSFFNGEDPNQWWGVLAYDNIAVFDGKLDYIEFEVDWEVTTSGDVYEPDDSWDQAWSHPHNYTSAFRSIEPVGDEDWITFSLSGPSNVVLETSGPSGDTRLWLYDGSLSEIEFDDDDGDGLFSRISRTGGSALPAGTYYAKVDEFGSNDTIADYAISLSVTSASLPDLTVPTLRSQGSTITEGDSFWIEGDVTNEGGSSAGSSHVELYLSIDDDFDVSDDLQVLPEKTVTSLGPGGEQVTRWTFTFPDVLDSTSYLVWPVFRVDSRNEVVESDENNIFKSVAYLTVWEPVDLAASDVFFRDQAAGGGSVVTDPAPGDLVYPHIQYDVSAASPVAGKTWQIELDGDVLCSFGGPVTDGPHTGYCISPWTATAGLHNLHGKLDPDGSILETDEGNNDVFRNYTVGSAVGEIRIEPLSLDFDEPQDGAALATGGMSNAGVSAAPTLDATPTPGAEGRWQRVTEAAAADGAVRVLVRLATPFSPEGGLGAAAAASQRQRIAELRSRLLDRLAGLQAHETARFHTIPFVALEVDAHALEALRRSPLVADVEEDAAAPPTLASSIPVIGADDAWAAGGTGAGWTVAVLDTGVDADHPFFTGGKVVSEACFSSNTTSASSVCPGGVESSTAAGSGAPCPASVAGCNHGTHVAGIAVGNDGSGPNIGVARDADVVAIQVFSRFDSSIDCGGSAPCARSYTSDQIQGLERVYDLRNAFDLAAANMSLGGGRFFSECDGALSSRKAAIDNLRSVGIATVISSGNSGYRDSMGGPACISTAVSVGATEDDDDVASLSNVAPFLDLVAPGVGVVSSVPGGGTASFSGTSMAAPHVTGAWAVLKQADPAASVDDLLASLRSTATTVADDRSGGIETDLRRINLDLAFSNVSQGGFTIFNDGAGPLQVSGISLAQSAPWISWSPPAPFQVPAGGQQAVEVQVDFAQAPAGDSQRRLLVVSDDDDESPYPGGVYVNVTRGQCAGLSLFNESVFTVETYESCGVIEAGDFLLQAPGDVTFRSGSGIVLHDGFFVGSGASFKAVIDPSLAP